VSGDESGDATTGTGRTMGTAGRLEREVSGVGEPMGASSGSREAKIGRSSASRGRRRRTRAVQVAGALDDELDDADDDEDEDPAEDGDHSVAHAAESRVQPDSCDNDSGADGDASRRTEKRVTSAWMRDAGRLRKDSMSEKDPSTVLTTYRPRRDTASERRRRERGGLREAFGIDTTKTTKRGTHGWRLRPCNPDN
jgi:hypothetical protein